MKKKIIALSLMAVVITACVPQKKYADLEGKYKEADTNNKRCEETLAQYMERNSELENKVEELIEKNRLLNVDLGEREADLTRMKKVHNDLNASYERLKANMESENRKMLDDLKKLEGELNTKEQQLDDKQAALEQESQANAKLLADLKEREAKMKELQDILAAKDNAVKELKDKLVASLLSFKDIGLTIQEKNGKVYVSLDESLLFQSGSIVVQSKGKEALLKLAGVLKANPDLRIMVEGHTDNVPMSSGQIKDNWDLSVLRATSVVRILTKDGGVDPKQLIGSGRGEYSPIAEGDSKEARAKNRRTEIIITPKLDELFNILDNN